MCPASVDHGPVPAVSSEVGTSLCRFFGRPGVSRRDERHVRRAFAGELGRLAVSDDQVLDREPRQRLRSHRCGRLPVPVPPCGGVVVAGTPSLHLLGCVLNGRDALNRYCSTGDRLRVPEVGILAVCRIGPCVRRDAPALRRSSSSSSRATVCTSPIGSTASRFRPRASTPSGAERVRRSPSPRRFCRIRPWTSVSTSKIDTARLLNAAIPRPAGWRWTRPISPTLSHGSSGSRMPCISSTIERVGRFGHRAGALIHPEARKTR